MSGTCGGCRGLGNHQRYCPRHPEYHPWRILAARAEDIGDTIGGNDPGIANRAYALSAAIKELIVQHPYRHALPPAPTPEAALAAAREE